MQTKATICTRRDNPINTYYSNVRAFSLYVWLSFAFALLLLSFAFWLTYSIYEKMPHKARLLKPPGTKLDFMIKTVAAIFEPDPLPWFGNSLYVGNFLYIFWSFFGLLMAMSYSSHLRASMITVDYEDNLDTMDKILLRVNRLYMIKNTARFQ